ncbi:MAG: hypothetical protein AVDCRST_MAG47-2306, partial [uncultured Nocardioidaceae bacterium]
ARAGRGSRAGLRHRQAPGLLDRWVRRRAGLARRRVTRAVFQRGALVPPAEEEAGEGGAREGRREGAAGPAGRYVRGQRRARHAHDQRRARRQPGEGRAGADHGRVGGLLLRGQPGVGLRQHRWRDPDALVEPALPRGGAHRDRGASSRARREGRDVVGRQGVRRGLPDLEPVGRRAGRLHRGRCGPRVGDPGGHGVLPRGSRRPDRHRDRDPDAHAEAQEVRPVGGAVGRVVGEALSDAVPDQWCRGRPGPL